MKVGLSREIVLDKGGLLIDGQLFIFVSLERETDRGVDVLMLRRSPNKSGTDFRRALHISMLISPNISGAAFDI